MTTPNSNIGVRLTGDGAHLHHLCKLKAAAWKKGYESIMREVAIETVQGFLKHSYPAPGNDPMAGNGNTPAAKQQGEYNLRRDINSMFYPLSKHSVKELVGMRNTAVFQLENPIQWQDESLAKAWESQDMDSLFMAFQSMGTATGENNDYINNELTYFKETQIDTVNYVGMPNEELHKSAMVRGRWDKKTRYAVRNREAVEQFLAKKMREVGKSANGWVDCLKQLGSMASSVMPGKGIGSVTRKDSKDSIVYSINNPYGNPNGMLDEAIAKVLSDSNQMLLKKTQELVDTVAKIKAPPRKRNR
jgi:hypothetical protein